uniref:Flap endonuclease n=1 Tax=Nilaparvata lugens endogenous nudivirus TaxID=1487700 RepID=X5GW85_9VIRU|nr:flap endonuclease [Nilaparvata lugens endogenous nudivirus]
MGILDGYTIVNHFTQGLYNKKPKHYNVYVDGKLMRYKGMIAENLTLPAPEEAIAHTSFQSLVRILAALDTHLGLPYSKVFVYMDGERVRNKTCDRPMFPYDTSLIRTTFKHYCIDLNYTVIELNYGESELQMYLDRDKSCDLNVFVTEDSDMLSICYNHQPTFIDSATSNTARECGDMYEFIYQNYQTPELLWSNEHSSSNSSIQDSNNSYFFPANVNYSVHDSCLWLANKTKSQAVAIGMDLCRNRIRFNDLVFRTFLALKGTDFTSKSRMCTNSMVQPFLNSSLDDINFINSQSEKLYHDKHPLCWNYIAVAILFLSTKCKRGSTLVRNSSCPTFKADDLEHLLSIYYKYVTTGIMNESTQQVNMGNGTRHYLYALYGGVTREFTKKNITNLTSNLSLSEAKDNFLKHFDTYTPQENGNGSGKLEIVKPSVDLLQPQMRQPVSPLLIDLGDCDNDEEDC